MSKIPELERQLKPCLYIFQIFGLHFFNINNLSQKFDPNKSRKMPSIGYIIYFLLLLAFFVAQNFMGFWEMHFGDHEDRSSVKTLIASFIEMGTVLMFFLTAVVMIVLSFATTHIQKSVFYNLLVISEQFELRLGKKLSFKRFKVINLIKSVFFVIMYLVSLTIINRMRSNSTRGIDKYLTWVGFTIVRIAFTGKLFTLYADLVHCFLRNIESAVNELIVDKIIAVPQPHSSSKNLIKVKSTCVNYQEFYHRILAMKSIYGLIWDTTNLINQCMGKILLFLLILVVVSVTAAGYKLFLVIVSNEPPSELIGNFGLISGKMLSNAELFFAAPLVYNIVILMGFFNIVYSAQDCSSVVSPCKLLIPNSSSKLISRCKILCPYCIDSNLISARIQFKRLSGILHYKYYNSRSCFRLPTFIHSILDFLLR